MCLSLSQLHPVPVAPQQGLKSGSSSWLFGLSFTTFFVLSAVLGLLHFHLLLVSACPFLHKNARHGRACSRT